MQDIENSNRFIKKTGRLSLYLIIAIPLFAVILAWLLYFYGTHWIPKERTNKGELLTPPFSVSQLPLMEQDTPFDTKAFEGHWTVLMFGSSPLCQATECQNMLYQTRQVHVALGRDSDRVTRVFVSARTPVFGQVYRQNNPNVRWLSGQPDPINHYLNTDHWPSDVVYLVDPLGNIMMKYQSGQAGSDLLKDLKKLLKASTIG